MIRVPQETEHDQIAMHHIRFISIEEEMHQSGYLQNANEFNTINFAMNPAECKQVFSCLLNKYKQLQMASLLLQYLETVKIKPLTLLLPLAHHAIVGKSGFIKNNLIFSHFNFFATTPYPALLEQCQSAVHES